HPPQPRPVPGGDRAARPGGRLAGAGRRAERAQGHPPGAARDRPGRRRRAGPRSRSLAPARPPALTPDRWFQPEGPGALSPGHRHDSLGSFDTTPISASLPRRYAPAFIGSLLRDVAPELQFTTRCATPREPRVACPAGFAASLVTWWDSYATRSIADRSCPC